MDNNRDDYNKGGFYAFVFSVIFCLVFFFYISFLHPQIDLKEITRETPVGGAGIKVDLSKIEKPWVENADILAHGAKVYANNCVACHGPKGMGDGPAGAALNPPARNFVEGKWKIGGTSKDLFTTLQNGIPGSSMASFKHLSVLDRWGLVQFIRSITKNKIEDDAAQMDEFGKTAQ